MMINEKEDLESYVINHFDMNTDNSRKAKDLLMDFSKRELERVDGQIKNSLLFFNKKVLPELKDIKKNNTQVRDD